MSFEVNPKSQKDSLASTSSLLDRLNLNSNLSSEKDFAADLFSTVSSSTIQPSQNEIALNEGTSPSSAAVVQDPTSLFPAIMGVVGRILHELETEPARLLSLNRSRREAIVRHLEILSGKPLGQGSSADPSQSGGDRLKLCLGRVRDNDQSRAMRCYYEEVALTYLGQVILLKKWSDAGTRKLQKSDLANLSWALNSALKGVQSLDREPRQITKQNLYSWYVPSETIQRELWNALEPVHFEDVGPDYLSELVKYCWQASPDWPELRSYDDRFFAQLAKISESDLAKPTAPSYFQRRKKAFTPTLRDGRFIDRFPATAELEWFGFEGHLFQLILTELKQLWVGPSAPPSWLNGSGLAAFSGDQLSLDLGSPIPCSLKRIKEMEDFDLGYLLEERAVRIQGKSLESIRLRELIEQFPLLKKMKGQGTSLGGLQACLAISKLRPGGVFWWIREEPLSAQEGTETLQFILERATLQCEWDFSRLKSAFVSKIPLFPKYVYRFQREPGIEKRLGHHPTRIEVSGLIRSHVEVSMALEEALVHQASSRESIQIDALVSPSSQKDWMDRWPDTAQHEAAARFIDVKGQTTPLASIASVQHTGTLSTNTVASILESTSANQNHDYVIWLSTHSGSVETFDEPNERTTFNVRVSDPAWKSVFRDYLESNWVKEWLQFSIAQRGGKTAITERDLRWIPVPNAFIKLLTRETDLSSLGATGQIDLSAWTQWKTTLAKSHETAIRELESLSASLDENSRKLLKASAYLECSHQLDVQRRLCDRFKSVIKPNGEIWWKGVIDLLPTSESLPLSFHPEVEIAGKLSSHAPIAKIERMKKTSTTFVLATESGMVRTLHSKNMLICDMIEDQLEGITHPTWAELALYLKLPKNVNLARETAHDILETFHRSQALIRSLKVVLESCL